MEIELRQKWINALRSGNYQQTQKHLRDKNGYCCLGVLCDVFDKNKWSEVPDNIGRYCYDGGCYQFLPLKLANMLNLGSQGKLTDMNDKGKSFEEIADYIEENF